MPPTARERPGMKRRSRRSSSRRHFTSPSVNSRQGTSVHRLPVVLHAHDGPALARPPRPSPCRTAELVGPVVGKLARRVVVMDEQREPRTAAGHGPLQHLQVAVRVAERGDGPAADAVWMPIGLPSLSSTKSISGSLIRTGLPSRISNFSLPLLPITCSGGMPYTRSAHGRMNSTPPPDTM